MRRCVYILSPPGACMRALHGHWLHSPERFPFTMKRQLPVKSSLDSFSSSPTTAVVDSSSQESPPWAHTLYPSQPQNSKRSCKTSRSKGPNICSDDGRDLCRLSRKKRVPSAWWLSNTKTSSGKCIVTDGSSKCWFKQLLKTSVLYIKMCCWLNVLCMWP